MASWLGTSFVGLTSPSFASMQLINVIDPLLSIHEYICQQESKFDDEVRRRSTIL